MKKPWDGLGGWMLFFFLVCGFNILCALYASLVILAHIDVVNGLRSSFALLSWVIKGLLFFEIMRIMIQRSWEIPGRIIGLLFGVALVTIVFAGADIFLRNAFGSWPEAQKITAVRLREITGAVMGAVVWWLYFMKSMRVHDFYGDNLGTGSINK